MLACQMLASIGSDENSLKKVEQRLESLIGEMKWCCTPQRSNHWNVKFFQVQKIENCYVITIYVAGMRGAVFAKSPKSYELRQDAIDLLIFEEWKQRMTCGEHMLHLQMERESRKKAPLEYTCTLTVAKEGAWCMYQKGKGGVYISMKCDNKSCRMFKYQKLNNRKRKIAVSISIFPP